MASWTSPWRLPMWMVVLHSALLQVREGKKSCRCSSASLAHLRCVAGVNPKPKSIWFSLLPPENGISGRLSCKNDPHFLGSPLGAAPTALTPRWVACANGDLGL